MARFWCSSFLIFWLAALPWQPIGATPKQIYDESAEAAPQIEQALALAKKENKRVLLQFGANWCGWCHRLHQLFANDTAVAEELKAHYVVVMVDVNERHNQATIDKYGKPTRFGLPVLVVLDSNGKLLTTKDTGELEEGDHHSPAKVLEFLQSEKWAEPKKPVPLLPEIDAFVRRALDAIRKDRPELKADALAFGGITYSYSPSGDSFQDEVSVQFTDPASRKDGADLDGRKAITYKMVTVQISRDPAGRERLFVDTGGVRTTYEAPAKK